MKKIKKIYVCDPNLNKKCDKSYCAHMWEDGPCKYTIHKEYALIGTKPIKIEEFEKNNERI